MAKSIAIFIFLSSFVVLSNALPLSTSSRWIIDDENGERVKLVCGNWAAHMETMLPEGLDQQPLSHIARHIYLMGFNCVRLTWATYMFTRHSNLTVAQSFMNLGLHDTMSRIAQKNPQLLGLTIVDAQKAVVEELGRHGVMTVLDNQVGKPMWCCGNTDGNGFWGDKYFEPQEWLKGWGIVAKQYKDVPSVIGTSLRNEIRGPLQNQSVWYKYVEKGARRIHKANPNVLIIISGLDYDLDFSFLKKKPLKLDMKNKIVFETHRYAFTEGQSKWFLTQPLNKVCDTVTAEIMNKSGFLMQGENASPLFISEFGIDQRLTNPSDNYFLVCFMSFLAEYDLDWAVWALQGNYYLRDGQQGMEEMYGMFNMTWSSLRSPQYHEHLQLIRQKLQDPKSKNPSYHLLFHPQTGKCLHATKYNTVYAGDCIGASRWSHDGDGTAIRLLGTSSCLTASRVGQPVTLSISDCSEESIWKHASTYQLSNEDENGTELCLDFDSSYSTSRVLARKCIGLDEQDVTNPQTQWFKFVPANV